MLNTVITYYYDVLLNRVMYKLESDFKRELGCLGADAIDTDRVTSGAKIRNIYRDL